MNDIPRSEYPRPQFVRSRWLCLNGRWAFARDAGDSGEQRGLIDGPLDGEILVPFCPESPLSGIGDPDFHNAAWYRREVRVPDAWQGRDVWLRFQAVDYEATVWVDGERVAQHRGGFAPFACNLGQRAGTSFTLTVRARDDHRQPTPKGKQSSTYGNRGCHYTRTTGIWQTVWLEPLATAHLKRPRITPDPANRRFALELPISRNAPGQRVEADLLDGGEIIDSAACEASSSMSALLTLTVPPERLRLWAPGKGELYDIALRLFDADGRLLDEANAYAGMRSVAIDGRKILINGRPVFQRLVLDQGYYPDGILTAPDDEALIRDIELAMAAGFNGARLHQKVFEERFLYHADRLGYLVWGEYGDWFTNLGNRCSNAGGVQPYDANFVSEWLEVVQRDYSHPAIVGWCPMNETFRLAIDPPARHDDCMRAMFLATKAADVTRPVLDSSGYSHTVAESDVYDSHDYQQDPEIFRRRHARLAEGEPFVNTHGAIDGLAYAGQPYFVSEFGGIRWNPDAEATSESWGYGEGPRTLDEFYDRFEKLCGILLDDPEMFGYCYTQLTDVFQEQNGIYRFDRREKFDMRRIAAAQQRPAAYEKAGEN